MSRLPLESHLFKQFPGTRIVSSRTLNGGISAAMTLFELEQSGGSAQKLIVREPGRHRIEANAGAAAEEFRVLSALHSAGLPVPAPLFVGDGFLAMRYIEGEPVYSPREPGAFLRAYAEQLAAIHGADWERLGLGFLPRQRRGFGPRPEKLNEVLRETEIRNALEAVSPPRHPNPAVLRHGDFWPGNVVWRDDAIVGVIDWEEALIGEPLADLAICRLDIWWLLGEDASLELTERYLAVTDVDATDLPYWDLCASLRPIANLHEWAASYPGLGRPDVTEATMARDHQAFVSRALARL